MNGELNNKSISALFEYCQTNNRVCPMPKKWSELYNLLNNKKQKASGGWEPSLPLILAAWHDQTDETKTLRMREHIQWAEKQNQLEEIGNFLRSLNEEDWFHKDE